MIQNSHGKRFKMTRQTKVKGPRNPRRMMKMCKKLPKSLRRSCFRRIKKKMKEMRKNKRKFINKKRNYMSTKNCGDCFKVGCCDQGTWAVGGDSGSYYGFNFQCRKDEKCRHCIECFRITLGKSPTKNTAGQGLDVESLGESVSMIPLPIHGSDEIDLDLTTEDPQEPRTDPERSNEVGKERNTEVSNGDDLDLTTLPQKPLRGFNGGRQRYRGYQGTPHSGSDTRWQKVKHPKNSDQDRWRAMKIKYDEKCIEEKCNACKNNSCCSYKDENGILSLKCNSCEKQPQCSDCLDCFNQITFKKKMFKNKKKKLLKGMSAGKQLKNYFENRKRNKNLEKLLMQRAGKYGKKINKNMMLKRKKNYRIIKMLKKLHQDP